MKTKQDIEPDESILTVDETILDKEWINQPRLFFRYAKQLAYARTSLEYAKANLKVVAAEVDDRLRRKAAKSTTKYTEAMISAAITRNKERRLAEEEVFDAMHLVDILFATTESLRQKKDALENLVKLHGQNYFSSPKVNSENKGRIDDLKMRRTVKNRKSGNA